MRATFSTQQNTSRVRYIGILGLMLGLLSTGPVYAQGFAFDIGSSDHDFVQSLKLDGNGDVLISGNFTGTVDFDPGVGTTNLTATGSTPPNDFFLAKYTAAGALTWVLHPGTTTDAEGMSVIAIDGSNNIYGAGLFNGTADFDPGPGTANLTSSSLDIFVAKYNTSGDYQWAFKIGAGNFDDVRGIAVDGAGNVFITGFFEGTVDFDPGAGTNNLISLGSEGDVYIAKYNTNGVFQWAFSLGINSAISGIGTGLVTDGAGNVYATGRFNDTVDFDPGAGTTNLMSAGSNDIYLAKYSGAGALLWAFPLGDVSADMGHALDIDGAGNIYITGEFQGTADFDPGAGTTNLISAGSTDIFMAKYTGAGALVWAKNMGGTSGDEAFAVAVDASNNVHITGEFRDTADMDPGAGTANIMSAGLDDIFVAKYDASGNHIWSFGVGGTRLEEGAAIDTGTAPPLVGGEDVFVGGHFSGTVDFDPGPSTLNLTALGGLTIYDGFVARYTSTGVLPVELTDFNAVSDGRGIWLEWTTASETNNAGFEIEHSTVIDEWTTLAFVDGHGTTSEPQHYSYRLADPAPGLHRFRLRQIDFDGAYEYSSRVEVIRDVPGTHVLSEAYPNPFNPQTTFTLALARAQHVQVQVFDALGRHIDMLHEGVLPADVIHRFTLGGTGLPTGIYLYRVTGENFAQTRQVMLIK